jgi:hypothetical protein
MHRIILIERNFATRANGIEIRNEIVKNLSDKSDKIVIDFSGINVIGNSFADEAFGKLISDKILESKDLTKKMKFENTTSLIKGIIMKALSKRYSEIN